MKSENSRKPGGIVFRTPKTDDGKYFWEIAKASQALDVNSTYHYLIMCRHFEKTCVVAEKNRCVVGFVTAYIPPEVSDTIFVWQVAVDKNEQGKGLGVNMLINLVESLKKFNVKNLDATITPSNQASVNLFKAAARALKAPYEFTEEFFSAANFGQNVHEPEMLFHIGPISD